MDTYWTIHIISTILWAALNAYLAGRNNRSRLAWFLISLPLGFFATLFLIVLKPLPAERQSSRS